MNRGFLCCLLMWVASAWGKADLAQIEVDLEDNPKLALEQVEKIWQANPEAVSFEVKLLLINAHLANDNFDTAAQLITDFSQVDGLSLDQQAILLAQKINWLVLSKNDHDIAQELNQADLLIDKLEDALDRKPDQDQYLGALYALNRAIGKLHYFAADFALAEPYMMQALKYVNLEKHKTHSDLLNDFGVVQAQQAQYAKAAEFMLKSIKLLEDNDLTIEVKSYQNLGSLYFYLKEWDKSIEYSKKALSIAKDVDKLVASLNSNIAAAYIEKQDFQQAIEFLQKSIQISSDLGTSTATARNNLGYLYKELGLYEKALEQLNLSAAELADNKNPELIGVSYKSRADVYAAMKDYDAAIAMYEQAYATFKQHDFKSKRIELYPAMIEVLADKGAYQRAYELMQEYKALNDAINDIESTKQVKEMMTSFEVEKNKQALLDSELVRAQQQKNIDLLNSKNISDERIRTLMIIMVSALLLLLFFILRSWRFRGKVNKVLLDKNERIESQQSQLVELNTQLKGQAEVDSLTGIKNRRYINNKLAEMIADPNQVENNWCLIIIDIDNFKTINDTYGHQRGDEVLQQFAACLDWVRSPEDVIARWGGEEFLWLVESNGQADGPSSCDAFQTALADLTWFRGNKDTVTCSLGFTSFPLLNMNQEDWEMALKLADNALYRAKDAGKNSWYGFELIDRDMTYAEMKDVDKLLQSKRLKDLTKVNK